MTLEQKILFYKALYSYVAGDNEETKYVGLCYHITRSLSSWYSDNRVSPIYAYNEYEFKKRLPELYAYRPPSNKQHWFPYNEEGKLQRLNIITEILLKLNNNANI